MAIVPEFLIKRIYQKGSLKKLENGASVVLKNVLGPGLISGFTSVKINDVVFSSENIKFIMNGNEIKGTDVSEENPVVFRLGQSGTLVMTGQDCVTEGTNRIEITAMNPEAGVVKLSVEDNV